MDLVRGRWLARVRPLVDRHQPYQTHQPLDPLAVDPMTLGRQPCRHPARAVIGPGQGVPIDQRHDRAVLVVDLGRSPVDRRAGTASNRHRCDTGSTGSLYATIARRSARPGSISGVARQKIVFDLQLANLPVQKIDLGLAGRPLCRRADPLENTRCAVQ